MNKQSEAGSMFIICPHCGYKDNELVEHDDDVKWDGDSEVLRCPQCHNRFRVDIHVELSYHTSETEDGCEEEGHEDTVGRGCCDYCGENMKELSKYPNEKMKTV